MIDNRGATAEPLPRRERSARIGGLPTPVQRESFAGADTDQAVRTQLAGLRYALPGVRGCVVAGVDGLLISHDLVGESEPHDLAALAATTFGLGRQAGLALRHGPFRESTVHSHRGYFAVYAVSETVLLAVLGDDGLNVARLHLEARPLANRLADLLHVRTA